MFKAYGVEAIPHTVIVGKDGKIAGVTDPLTLEAKHLENLLAGKEAGLPVDSDDVKLPPMARADEESLVAIRSPISRDLQLDLWQYRQE